MAGIVHKPSRGAPCQLHSRGVKSLQRGSTQSLPTKQKLREDSTWFGLIQSLCDLLICGVGSAKVTGAAHPCPHANPTLQGMSESFSKMVVQQLFKSFLCLQLSSLSLPSPEQTIPFSSFGFTSFQNKTFKRAPQPPHLCWLFQIYLDKLIQGSVRTNQF